MIIKLWTQLELFEHRSSFSEGPIRMYRKQHCIYFPFYVAHGLPRYSTVLLSAYFFQRFSGIVFELYGNKIKIICYRTNIIVTNTTVDRSQPNSGIENERRYYVHLIRYQIKYAFPVKRCCRSIRIEQSCQRIFPPTLR